MNVILVGLFFVAWAQTQGLRVTITGAEQVAPGCYQIVYTVRRA